MKPLLLGADPLRGQVGSMCRNVEGKWEHFARKAKGDKLLHVGPCTTIDHDGLEPWRPQACCCGRKDCRG